MLFVSFALLLVNAVVFFVLAGSGLLASRQSVFVLNLLLCDSVRGLVILVEVVTFLTVPGWDSLDTFCTVVGFFETLSSVCACVALPILLYDRLMFISSPINYLHRMTRRLATILLTYGVFHATLVSVLPLLGWGRYTYDERFHTCDVSWSTTHDGFPPFAVVWGWLLPLAATAVAFARLWRVVRKRVTQIRVYSKAQARLEPIGLRHCIGVGTITETDMAFFMTARLLAVIAACYGISRVFQLGLYVRLMVPVGLDAIASPVYVIATLVSLANGLVNPFMYAAYNRRFKQALARYVTCGRHYQSDVDDISEYPRPSAAMRELTDGPTTPRGGTRAGGEAAAAVADYTSIGIIVKHVWSGDSEV